MGRTNAVSPTSIEGSFFQLLYAIFCTFTSGHELMQYVVFRFCGRCRVIEQWLAGNMAQAMRIGCMVQAIHHRGTRAQNPLSTIALVEQRPYSGSTLLDCAHLRTSWKRISRQGCVCVATVGLRSQKRIIVHRRTWAYVACQGHLHGQSSAWLYRLQLGLQRMTCQCNTASSQQAPMQVGLPDFQPRVAQRQRLIEFLALLHLKF